MPLARRACRESLSLIKDMAISGPSSRDAEG